MIDSIYLTKFNCGCMWRSWTGEVGPQNNRWEVTCTRHIDRPQGCTCLNTGKDDGATTCWTHHDCFRGDCTHMDVDEEPVTLEQGDEW